MPHIEVIMIVESVRHRRLLLQLDRHRRPGAHHHGADRAACEHIAREHVAGTL
jgi:hypothetical protein